MSVVTMSGTIASGAREIGRAAASLLGIDYVDQQLLVDAARRLGVSVDVMACRDERCSSLGERLAAVLRGFLGRGSQMILRDLPGALRVLTLAPAALRVQRLADREGISREEAERQIRDR